MATSSLNASTPGWRARPGSPARTRVRGGRWWALALVAPLLLFLAVSFLGPVLMMLSRGVTDHELADAWPGTAAMLRQWDGPALPDDALARSLAAEVLESKRSGTISRVANRLNYDQVGSRSLVLATADALERGRTVRSLADLIRIDAHWGEPAIWATMRHAAQPVTSFYMLAAVDRRLTS